MTSRLSFRVKLAHTVLQAALLVISSLGTVAILSQSAFAASCNGIPTSVDFKCATDTDPVTGIVLTVVNFLAIGVGIAVVGGIVFGSVRYITANGNAGQAQQGVGNIRNAILGLVLFLFLYSLMNFLIPGGAFNANAPIKLVASTKYVPKWGTSEGLTASTRPPAKSNGVADAGLGGSSGGTGSGTGSTTSTNLTGVYNFRDVNGSTSAIKAGVLYRSANLSEATASDATKLAGVLKGGTIIDLRAKSVRSKAPDKKITGVTNTSIPIDAPDTGEYEDFVNDSDSRAAFGRAIELIASSNGPVLIHCTYGKDRTGWLVAMIMYSMGASDAQVMSEFLKSNADLPEGKSVKSSWLTAGLSAAKKKYGSVNNYITKGLGVDKATLSALKSKLGG